MENMKVNLGVTRIDNEVKYVSNTAKAQQFLTQRLRKAIAGWNRSNPNGPQFNPNAELALISRPWCGNPGKATKLFVPIWLMLPTEAVEGNENFGRRKKNNGNGSVYLPTFVNVYGSDGDGDNGNSNIKLKGPYSALVDQYSFGDPDEAIKSLRKPKNMMDMQLTQKHLSEIRRGMTPHLHRFGKHCTRVEVLINPTKLFEDMIESTIKENNLPNDRPYDVLTHASQKVSNGIWNYEICCRYIDMADDNGGKKKHKKDRRSIDENELIRREMSR